MAEGTNVVSGSGYPGSDYAKRKAKAEYQTGIPGQDHEAQSTDLADVEARRAAFDAQESAQLEKKRNRVSKATPTFRLSPPDMPRRAVAVKSDGTRKAY